MSNAGEDCRMVKTHVRKDISNLTRADEDILDRITRDEYEMLGPYLD